MELECDGHRFLARKGPARLAEDLMGSDPESLHPPRGGFEPDGFVSEKWLSHLDLGPGSGNAKGLFDGREFFRDLVLE
jgi:hypothetical protein